jgi:ferredoxin-NADP reductase
MAIFISRLLGRRIIARDTVEIELERPEKFTFEAGQYANVSFVGYDKAEKSSTTRTFTISSAPYEETITFILRITDSQYKKRILATPIGTEFEIEGPFGDFTLEKSKSGNITFIAGGMGVAPFISMIKEALARKETRTLRLFYFCRRLEEAPFLEMFNAWSELNKNFEFIAIMTKPEKPASDDNAHKHMTAELLQEHMPDTYDGDFYIAGPPGMVSSVLDLIKKKHLGNHIFTEEFIS